MPIRTRSLTGLVEALFDSHLLRPDPQQRLLAVSHLASRGRK
jgi:hypothetical protein